MALVKPDDISLTNLKQITDHFQAGVEKQLFLLESLRSRRYILNVETLNVVTKLTELENTRCEIEDQIRVARVHANRCESAAKELLGEVDFVKTKNEEIDGEIHNIQEYCDEILFKFEFEDQTDQLSDLFRNASLFYNPENIHTETENLEEFKKELTCQKLEYEGEISKLQENMQDNSPEIENLKLTLEFMKRENEQLKRKFLGE